MRLQALIPFAVAVAVGLVSPAAASAEPAAIKSGGFFFYAKASHGYTFSFDVRSGRASGTLVTGDRSGGTAAIYLLKGKTRVSSGGKVNADFGSFGTVRGRYVDKPGDSECSADSPAAGTFRGTIDFEGEGGYARIDAKTARASAHAYVCHGHSRQAAPRFAPLNLGRGQEPALLACRPDDGLIYGADDFGKATLHTAISIERTKSLRIYRQTQFYGDPKTFAYTNDLSSATVSPGGYFEGSATYADGMLTGDLSVALAGLDRVSLVPGVAGMGDARTGEFPPKCVKLASTGL